MQTKHIYLVLLIFSIISCENDSNLDIELDRLMPNTVGHVIETDNLELLISEYTSNKLLSSGNTELVNFLNQLRIFNYNGNAILGYKENTEGEPEIHLLLKSEKRLLETDSLLNFTSETEIRGKDSLFIYTIDSTNIYCSKKKSLHLLSNNKDLAKEFTFKPNKDKLNTLEPKLKFRGNHLTINSDKSTSPFPLFLSMNEIEENLKIANSANVSFDLESNSMTFNGITNLSGSNPNLLNLFKNTVPQENRFSDITPASIDAAYSFTFDDVEKFYKNLKTVYTKDSIDESYKFQNEIEFTLVVKNGANALIVNSLNIESSMERMGDKSLVESYKEFDIYENTEYSEALIFAKKFQINTYRFFVTIDDFMVLTNSKDFLKDIISAHTNESTLAKSDSYKAFIKEMSDESSLVIFYNKHSFQNKLASYHEDYKTMKLDENFKYISQFIVENNFAHVNALMGSKKGTPTSRTISEDLNFTFDTALIGDPQFVENHLNKSMDIVVQDVNNYLYMIDNTGKLLFKRQLDGNIIGEINQIDSFKNKRKQLVFATDNTLYVIARNGKDVSNFPKKLRDRITQPISVFDYDKRRNYRILVTQGNELLMLDKDGKRVNGFKYKKQSGNISTQPKHFRFGGKDYIVFAQGKAIRILSRTGKDRILVAEKFNFSDNQIFPYQDNFTFVDDSGNLVQVDARGRVERNSFYQPVNPKIASTSKTLVSLDENRLKIRANTVNLQFGQYSDPKVFYLNNKIYVSVTDLQTKKVYLYDSQAKLISGFPVYGSSSVDLGNFDNDNALELLTKDGDDSILVYEFN